MLLSGDGEVAGVGPPAECRVKVLHHYTSHVASKGSREALYQSTPSIEAEMENVSVEWNDPISRKSRRKLSYVTTRSDGTSEPWRDVQAVRMLCMHLLYVDIQLHVDIFDSMADNWVLPAIYKMFLLSFLLIKS